MPQDYNATVNLPKTEFPMRAGLPKREPEMLNSWYEMGLYEKMVARNEGKPRFILHDGPPFSNGYIHMGTALNKCLKDFIVRYKNMAGFQAPYIPGWDNHGMPIESAIIKQNKLDRKSMSIPEFRDKCKEFAEKFVNIQRYDFVRLGVLGQWDDPYLTMAPEFEAEEVRVFGQMFEKGYIYKGKKPVYWCPHDETALAEAEIEYAEDACRSVYVKFPISDDGGKLAQYGDVSKMSVLIWTTTTWTLPGNLAICIGAQLEYVFAKLPGGEILILAKELAEEVLKKAGIESFETLAVVKGSELELMTAKHPLYDRTSLIICGDHITLEAGTGCVHTAPGHGQEDFEVCQKYNREHGTDIGILVPMDDRGHMTAEAGKYEGLYYEKANKVIFEDLEASNMLLCFEDITHQYAHCWRCKKPIVYRATDQWFCSVEAFKDEATAAAESVQWIPDWGKDRMISMVRDRADWCISRQRQWGLPIPVFYCEDCKKPVCTVETIELVAKFFAKRGSNVWFESSAEDLLPSGFACPHCGGAHFSKETDTLDGWFDSGSSHIAALQQKTGEWPATMYLEGGDQFRGWFQSGLLTAVACRGEAPYKIVLSHGWTVDGDGKAMHKSLGNSVLPSELIPKYGAELIRLWAASADYRADMRCSDGIFKQLSETYLKIRNTSRYILGNLDGFDPNTGCVPFDDMLPIDKWALAQLDKLVQRCVEAYDKYEFFTVIHAIHRFCVVEMSNFYLDVLKDRLYCEDKNGPARHSGQTAIYTILDSIVRLIAPILAFTSNEIWQSMPHDASANAEHIMLNDMPTRHPEWELDAEMDERWNLCLSLRDDVNKALELARNEKKIGKPLEAKLTIFVGEAAQAEFKKLDSMDLSDLFIVSEVDCVLAAGEGFEAQWQSISIKVEQSSAPKCIRCWTHSYTVGTVAEHPELCERCANTL